MNLAALPHDAVTSLARELGWAQTHRALAGTQRAVRYGDSCVAHVFTRYFAVLEACLRGCRSDALSVLRDEWMRASLLMGTRDADACERDAALRNVRSFASLDHAMRALRDTFREACARAPLVRYADTERRPLVFVRRVRQCAALGGLSHALVMRCLDSFVEHVFSHVKRSAASPATRDVCAADAELARWLRRDNALRVAMAPYADSLLPLLPRTRFVLERKNIAWAVCIHHPMCRV